MARTATGRAGYLVAGAGFGVAAGVALGVFALGPNMPDGRAAEDETVVAERAKQAESAAAEAERQSVRADVSDGAVAQLIPAAVEDTLSGHPVLVIATADAAGEDVAAVEWLLGEAGALDAGSITLTERFFAQDSADELKTIVTNTLPAGAQLSTDALDPGTQVGESFGSALLLDPATAEQQATSEERALLLQTLREAGFIDYPDGTVRPAQVVVVVTGGDDGSTDGSFAARNLASFTASMDARGSGAVLAGRLGAAGEQGPVGVVRANDAYADEVTTVDSVGLEVGRGAAALGVGEQLAGEAGAYGAAEEAQAPLPEPPA